MSYTKDQNGKLSSNRLMFIVGMLSSLVIPTVMVLFKDWTAAEFIGSFSAMSAIFATLKVSQKSLEHKTP